MLPTTWLPIANGPKENQGSVAECQVMDVGSRPRPHFFSEIRHKPGMGQETIKKTCSPHRIKRNWLGSARSLQNVQTRQTPWPIVFGRLQKCCSTVLHALQGTRVFVRPLRGSRGSRRGLPCVPAITDRTREQGSRSPRVLSPKTDGAQRPKERGSGSGLLRLVCLLLSAHPFPGTPK